MQGKNRIHLFCCVYVILMKNSLLLQSFGFDTKKKKHMMESGAFVDRSHNQRLKYSRWENPKGVQTAYSIHTKKQHDEPGCYFLFES